MAADYFLSPSIVITTVIILGLIVGSFLNVVIYRLPIMMDREEKIWAQHVLYGKAKYPPDAHSGTFNLLVPSSHCPVCQYQIRVWENIPILSYLLQRGCCRGCSSKIPVQYLIVEILTAIASGLVAWKFPDLVQLGLALLFTWGLIALFFIDLNHQILPDKITLPLLWLGILAALLGEVFLPLRDSIIGVVVGYGLLWLISWIFKLFTGREGIGYGDFKLVACICAWQNILLLPMILVIATVTGIIYAFITRLDRGNSMAFGPFLITAGWLSFLWGDALMQWTDLLLSIL